MLRGATSRTLAFSGNEAADEYLRLYQQGSPLYYARGLGFAQPVPFALGIMAALAAVAAPSRWMPGNDAQKQALRSVAWFALVVLAVAAVYPQKNLRFLSPILGPLYLLGGALVAFGVDALRKRMGRNAFVAGVLVVGLAVAGLAVRDQRVFTELLAANDGGDLATPMLLEAPERLRQLRGR